METDNQHSFNALNGWAVNYQLDNIFQKLDAVFGPIFFNLISNLILKF